MTDAGTFALLGYCHASILHLAAEIISQAMCNAGLTAVDTVVPVNCDFCTAKCELAAKASSTGAKQSETPLGNRSSLIGILVQQPPQFTYACGSCSRPLKPKI